MADYQQGRHSGYDRSSDARRNAAFSNIFEATPPSGRSQTMASSSMPPGAGILPQGRTETMASSSSLSQARMQQQQQQQLPPRTASNFNTRGTDGMMVNGWGGPSYGFNASQRSLAKGERIQNQHQPQYVPGPARNDTTPYPAPQRVDPRGSQSPLMSASSQQSYPTSRPGAARYYSSPALKSDQYRSQSMAGTTQPQTYRPLPSSATAFRQTSYQPHASRQTAQGRIVPERQDLRTMAMTSYLPHSEPQTMSSGRIIPNRTYSVAMTPPPEALQAVVGSSFDNVHHRSMTNETSRPTNVASTASDSRMVSVSSTQSKSSITKSISNRTGRSQEISKAPLVYPALLSRVGDCFRDRISVGTRMKDNLEYKSAFTGAEAVDLISYIIKTTDRNLALLLGRTLDAQKFFHDVTYVHRLRDSPSEIYQFRETLDEPLNASEVNGVFVLLTECYSPTCTPEQLCYSIACPRRLEQQHRLNLKPQPGLRREKSQMSLYNADEADGQKLWINSVSQEIADSVGDREKKRQEVISEIIYTERDFVKDLEYLRDFWISPLRSSKPTAPSVIPATRRDRIVSTIFSNIVDHPSIHKISSRFAKALTDRQCKHPVVQRIGDIFLEFIPQFEPFIIYGSRQLVGKFEFEKERSLNPHFSKFVDETERKKESRKLELNGYLTKPTTRLARYPLLLENVLKYTDPSSQDLQDIPKAIQMIKDLLTRVNMESGKAENRFNLQQLHEQLRFRPNERVDLKLTDEQRKLVYKGNLKKSPTDLGDIQVYLFDHAVLLVRVKMVGKKEEMKVYRKPIPLGILFIKEMDEVIPRQDPKKDVFPITFKHLGKGGYEVTLYASTQGSWKKWLELINEQQNILRSRGNFYNKTILMSNFFSSDNHVNCVTPFDGGRKLIYGTDFGIYISDRRIGSSNIKPRRVLDITNVTQIDVLEEYQLLLVLSTKTLLSYTLSALDPDEPALSKRPKKIQSHCSFFKTGICLGRHLVCGVKSSALSTTIKVFEPNDAISKGKKQKGFRVFGSQDELKAIKEFYIPTESSSIHFLKSALCVACARGFEVVSLETLESQSLLDQADTSLDFVAGKESSVRPIHIERLNGEFLLSYSEFSFFVNRNGWRARPDWRIDWDGTPQSFALSYPWILAFEPNFIQMCDIEGDTVHMVLSKNIRMLNASTREIIYAYEDERGGDVVATIDFWPQGQKA